MMLKTQYVLQDAHLPHKPFPDLPEGMPPQNVAMFQEHWGGEEGGAPPEGFREQYNLHPDAKVSMYGIGENITDDWVPGTDQMKHIDDVYAQQFQNKLSQVSPDATHVIASTGHSYPIGAALPKGSNINDVQQQQEGFPANQARWDRQQPSYEAIQQPQEVQTGEPMDISFRLLKEMYHATMGSPASIAEYGIVPPAENPANQMGVNMQTFTDWWDKEHGLFAGRPLEEVNQQRTTGITRLPPITREDQERALDERQHQTNLVWAAPTAQETAPYLDPSGKRGLQWNPPGYGGGASSSAKQPTSREKMRRVLEIDDSADFKEGGPPPYVGHGWYHEGAVPPDKVKDAGLMQAGEPMDISFRLLKTYQSRVRGLSNKNINRAKSNIRRRHLKVGVRRTQGQPHSGRHTRGSAVRRRR